LKRWPGALASPVRAGGNATSATLQAPGSKDPAFDDALAAQDTVDEEMWR